MPIDEETKRGGSFFGPAKLWRDTLLLEYFTVWLINFHRLRKPIVWSQKILIPLLNLLNHVFYGVFNMKEGSINLQCDDLLGPEKRGTGAWYQDVAWSDEGGRKQNPLPSVGNFERWIAL